MTKTVCNCTNCRSDKTTQVVDLDAVECEAAARAEATELEPHIAIPDPRDGTGTSKRHRLIPQAKGAWRNHAPIKLVVSESRKLPATCSTRTRLHRGQSVEGKPSIIPPSRQALARAIGWCRTASSSFVWADGNRQDIQVRVPF